MRAVQQALSRCGTAYEIRRQTRANEARRRAPSRDARGTCIARVAFLFCFVCSWSCAHAGLLSFSLSLSLSLRARAHDAGCRDARLGSLLGRHLTPLRHDHAADAPAEQTARGWATRWAAKRAQPRPVEASVPGPRRNARPQWAARFRGAERGRARRRIPRVGAESVDAHACRLRGLRVGSQNNAKKRKEMKTFESHILRSGK